MLIISLNNLIVPLSDSEYTQLKGRIYRQGSKFGDVEIIIPLLLFIKSVLNKFLQMPLCQALDIR